MKPEYEPWVVLAVVAIVIALFSSPVWLRGLL